MDALVWFDHIQETRSGMTMLKTLLLLASGMLAAGCSAERSQAGETASPSPSEAATPLPGTYATEAGWGQLRIERHSDEVNLRFKLETENSGYGCSMQGTIGRDKNAVLVDSVPGGSQCKLTMRKTTDGVEVATSSPEACSAFCGENGSFEGDYVAVEAACTNESIATLLKRIPDAADASTEAARSLQAVLKACGRTLGYSTTADIRLALASKQHQSGDNATCLVTLSPYAEDASRSDDELIDGMTPAVADETVGVMTSVRELMTLCGN